MKNHMTRHHVIPQERRKKKNHKEDQSGLHTDSTLKLWQDRHNAWHTLFKNMTLDEIIICLQKVRWGITKKELRLRTKPLNESYFIKAH